MSRFSISEKIIKAQAVHEEWASTSRHGVYGSPPWRVVHYDLPFSCRANALVALLSHLLTQIGTTLLLPTYIARTEYEVNQRCKSRLYLLD